MSLLEYKVQVKRRADEDDWIDFSKFKTGAANVSDMSAIILVHLSSQGWRVTRVIDKDSKVVCSLDTLV